MRALGGLARFTPSVLDKETLEALFVHRESLVDDAVERIRRASTSKERSSRLFVGPRGAGKTHLVSLIAHRARALDGFGEAFQLAWLPEDLWAIGDFEDLRKEILKCIEPGEPLADTGAMDGGPREFGARVAQRGPVVVIIENLDQVLQDLGPDGQRKLRAAIESDRSMLLIATATRLTSDLLDQDEPFYGFFDTYDLQQFDVDEAADMLKAIARQRGDQALVDELDKPQARARLAAVAHLAGGQPRIWALFGAGLTVEGLDDLVSVLIERFDDLTPYYQEQLRRLSVNERKAVQALAEADRALPVRALAEVTGIQERSLSKTMGDLRKAGWVRVKTGRLIDLVDGRLTYYELAEPLARLAFQLKASHGEPVKLVVEFLRTWFESDELDGLTESSAAVAPYLEAVRASWESDAAAASCRLLVEGGVEHTGRHLVPEAVDLLLSIDRGLVAFAAGDPELLLDLPGSISSLLDERLATTSVSQLRFDVLRRVVEADDPRPWVAQIDAAIGGAEGEERDDLLVLRALVHLQEGEPGPAREILASVAGRWQSKSAEEQRHAYSAVRVASTAFGRNPSGVGIEWLLTLIGGGSGLGAMAALGMTRAAAHMDPRGMAERWVASSPQPESEMASFALALLGFVGSLIGPSTESVDDLSLVNLIVPILSIREAGNADRLLGQFELLAATTAMIEPEWAQRGVEAVQLLRDRAETGDWYVPPMAPGSGVLSGG